MDPGGYSLTGDHPIMVKLRQETNTVVTGSLLTPNSAVAVGSAFNLNMYPLTVSNTGLPSDFVATVNAFTVNTGVTAALVEEPPTVQTDSSLLSSYGVVFVQVPSAVEINGVTVNFTTTTSGTVSFGPGYGDQYDMASDINNASVVGIVATATSTGLIVANTALGPVDFTNVGVDGAGNPFAGPGSSSGLALTTTSGNSYITLTSAGAAAINLLDTVYSPTVDFGLYSAENGVKAAALYVEQGIRQASSYYVANIAARDALTAGVGDQAYVQDIGDGTWAMYIYTIGNIWVMTANQPSSETDAQSIEVYITPTSNSTGTIHTITNGRRVSFVTVTVNVAFDTDATISVGDSSQSDRLMTTDQNDLTITDTYSTTPSYVYETGSDTAINFYFDANGSSVGNATVAITYI
jgi:hypothetical protein